jgi:hypothetical protein
MKIYAWNVHYEGVDFQKSFQTVSERRTPMHVPKAVSHMETQIQHYFPHLRASQQQGLALWVYGTILAKSACQNAVVLALHMLGRWNTLRQRLREWLYAGQDKAAPCHTELPVDDCFGPLLRWVLSWWQGSTVAVGLDATLLKDHLVALVLSVLYRGNAIPIAWVILPANRKGAWMPHILRLMRQLRPAIPPEMEVLVLADRGLWSPRLWRRIRRLHWHPLLRLQGTVTFAPAGQTRQPVQQLVPGPGTAWVGQGRAFRHRPVRGTLIVVWEEGHKAPWVLLTDLPPDQVGIVWYGLRIWIELGFRALKGVGWQWQRTRRTDPQRVARHWLVLAVAMLWVLAYGTRVEDAEQLAKPPAHVLTPPPAPEGDDSTSSSRLVSVFLKGWSWMQMTLFHGYLWTRLWLVPEPWPSPSAQLNIVYHNGGP